MFDVIINDEPIAVKDESLTILQLCETLNISIPRFCYHNQLTMAGNCRMRMVEVKKIPKPVIACATSIAKGMEVYTNSTLVQIARENVLEFLLINHPLDCPICDQAGECDLQDQTIVYGSDRGRFKEEKRSVEDKEFGPVIKTIMTRCIHRTRCVRYAEEIAGEPVIGTMGRGRETEISTYKQEYFLNEISGNIVDICPVGALTSKPYAFRARPWELSSVESIDLFDSLCSTIKIDVKGNEILRILPKRNDNLNTEWITDKVRFSYQGLKIDRMTFPFYKKLKKKNYTYVTCSWLSITKKFIRYIIPSLLENNLSISVGEFLSIETIKAIKYFIFLFNVKDLKTPLYSTMSVDLRINWLLNESISNLLENQYIILYNTDLRVQNSVLHARIFNLKYAREDECKLINIGSFTFTNTNSRQIGISKNTLYNVLFGKHYICKELNSNEKMHWLLSEKSSVELKVYLQLFIGSKKNVSFIAPSPTYINMSELGMKASWKHVECKLNYLISVEKLETIPEINRRKIIISQNMYIIESVVHTRIVDVFLPATAYTEEIGTYLNLENKCMTSMKAVDAPALVMCNATIINMFTLLISSCLADSITFDINKISKNERIHAFENYTAMLSNLFLPSMYKNTNRLNNVQYKGIDSVICDRNLFFEKISLAEYYAKDSISQRSRTLQEIFSLRKINQKIYK